MRPASGRAAKAGEKPFDSREDRALYVNPTGKIALRAPRVRNERIDQRFLNRIVFTYLDYLLFTDQQMTDQKKSEFRFSYRNSIEHFYPQHPAEGQSGAKFSQEKYLHVLGNLALVSVGANSQFSNSIPEVKAANFLTTIKTQSPKLQIMGEIARQSGWGDDQVRDHDVKMIERLRLDLGGSSGESSSGGS